MRFDMYNRRSDFYKQNYNDLLHVCTDFQNLNILISDLIPMIIISSGHSSITSQKDGFSNI